jgi:hypothetical protein
MGGRHVHGWAGVDRQEHFKAAIGAPSATGLMSPFNTLWRIKARGRLAFDQALPCFALALKRRRHDGT